MELRISVAAAATDGDTGGNPEGVVLGGPADGSDLLAGGKLASGQGMLEYEKLVPAQQTSGSEAAGCLLSLILGPILGALLLASADLVSRIALYPIEIPVGITTTLIGVPALLLALRRQDHAR